MLTIAQKADILQKTGIPVPAAPAPSPSAESLAAVEPSAMVRWTAAVEALFVNYVAARAAKSLRDAEERRQLVMLREMSVSSPVARRAFQRA